MKKIKAWISNKNFILIVCVVIIVILSFTLGYIVNNKKLNNNKQETTTKHLDTDEEKQEKSEKSSFSNIKKDNTSEKSNSSNTKKDNTSEKSNFSNTRKANTNEKTNTSSSSKKESNNNKSITYTCTSGYTLNKSNNTCYKKVLSSSKIGSCPNGYSIYITDDLKEKCRKYVINDDVMIYSDPFCVDSGNTHQYLSLEDNACLEDKNRINKSYEDCVASGYLWSKKYNYCYTSKANIMYMQSCPSGWTLSDSIHCYKYDIIDRVFAYSCPSSYTLSDDKQSCLDIKPAQQR